MGVSIEVVMGSCGKALRYTASVFDCKPLLPYPPPPRLCWCICSTTPHDFFYRVWACVRCKRGVAAVGGGAPVVGTPEYRRKQRRLAIMREELAKAMGAASAKAKKVMGCVERGLWAWGVERWAWGAGLWV
jgi:hypothetical protein